MSLYTVSLAGTDFGQTNIDMTAVETFIGKLMMMTDGDKTPEDAIAHCREMAGMLSGMTDNTDATAAASEKEVDSVLEFNPTETRIVKLALLLSAKLGSEITSLPSFQSAQSGFADAGKSPFTLDVQSVAQILSSLDMLYGCIVAELISLNPAELNSITPEAFQDYLRAFIIRLRLKVTTSTKAEVEDSLDDTVAYFRSLRTPSISA